MTCGGAGRVRAEALHKLGKVGISHIFFQLPARMGRQEDDMNHTPPEGAGLNDSSEGSGQPPAHPRFAKPQRVAFVQSAWHRDFVSDCREAFLVEIEARHIARAHVDVFEVPGSFEIPLHVQILAKTRRYTAIVAAGLVIDDEYVAETVIKALMDVQLRTEVPVFSAVVTPQQFNETEAHVDFFRKHFATKGREVAEACANTLLSLERLRGQVAAGIM